MSSRKIDRRDFLSRGARAGLAICGACLCARSPLFAGSEESGEVQEALEPAKLNHCGYTCPKDCKFLHGTKNDDVELKQAAWKAWKIEERFGLPFDPDQAICHGCKSPGQPEGVVLRRCDVRACAREKGLECCIECGELTACDKDLWRRFPDFKKQVVEMQARYRAQG